MQEGSLGFSRRSPRDGGGQGRASAQALLCQHPPTAHPRSGKRLLKSQQLGQLLPSAAGISRGTGEGIWAWQDPPGHSLPAAAGVGDVLKATGRDSKRGEEGSKCQATSCSGGSQGEDGSCG